MAVKDAVKKLAANRRIHYSFVEVLVDERGGCVCRPGSPLTDLPERWDEMALNGEPRVPITIDHLVYDFDFTYWTQFAMAYEEPTEFLSVLTRKERFEVAAMASHYTCGDVSPMFAEELCEVTHLVAEPEYDPDVFADVFDPAQIAYVVACLPEPHLPQGPFHGENRRLRSYRKAARETRRWYTGMYYRPANREHIEQHMGQHMGQHIGQHMGQHP